MIPAGLSFIAGCILSSVVFAAAFILAMLGLKPVVTLPPCKVRQMTIENRRITLYEPLAWLAGDLMRLNPGMIF